MLAYCDMTSIRNVFLCQCTQKRERKMNTLKNARAIAIKQMCKSESTSETFINSIIVKLRYLLDANTSEQVRQSGDVHT